MGRRCLGHCCREFTLEHSPAELAEAYRLHLHGQDTILDIDIIFPMVQYLGFRWGPDGSERAHYYACRWLDDESGDCRIYEHRPTMCRVYPETGKCGYHECAWDAVRATPDELVQLGTRSDHNR